MKDKTENTRARRNSYPQPFKDEALALAERIGVPAAAKELGLHSSQLYGWRSKTKRQASQSEVEKAQAIP